MKLPFKIISFKNMFFSFAANELNGNITIHFPEVFLKFKNAVCHTVN